MSQLECIYCDKGFNTFEALSRHVKRCGQKDSTGISSLLDELPENEVPEELPSAIENKISSLVRRMVGQITLEVTKAMPKSMQLPDPEQGSGKDYNPWFTPEVLGKSGKGTATILGHVRESTSQFGKGIIVDVKCNGDNYSWTIKFSSGNYERLHKRFGKNVDKWRGKVNVEIKEYMGKDYIAVV
jgi:hypothetical protein